MKTITTAITADDLMREALTREDVIVLEGDAVNAVRLAMSGLGWDLLTGGQSMQAMGYDWSYADGAITGTLHS